MGNILRRFRCTLHRDCFREVKVHVTLVIFREV